MAYSYKFSLTQNSLPRPPYVNHYGYDKRTILSTYVGNVAWFATRQKNAGYSSYDLYYIGHDELSISYKYTEYLKGEVQTQQTIFCSRTTMTHSGHPITQVRFGSVGLYEGVVTSAGGRVLNETFYIDVPIFDTSDTDSITNYIEKGDTSGSIKDIAIKWNLYIDGTKNPLYKLTWDNDDIPKSEFSKVKVMFCAQDDAIANTYIVKDTRYYDYNDKSVKLNYHDIHEEVWGDTSGIVKGAITMIVRFEYYATTTVLPTETSSYMYCELYPSETNGHMYGNIGFCKVGEHSTWFVKTDSGDGSTFTAHEGTDGSDGYTKDDDKGYDDNKDKDADDNDTHVLSSGIGVLTSTFHMTKERLVQ